jgi:NAD(P)-dependent dehydrogenase (short-subunit alcohol dehydrogenase family)
VQPETGQKIMEGSGTALVTGASKRIGRAIAIDLAQIGWSVGVHFHESDKDAAQTIADIEKSGGRAIALPADLGNLEAVCGLVPEVARKLDAPTLLINNASLFERDRIADLSPASWQSHIDVNLRAPVFLAQSFARHLPKDRDGVIINVLDQRVWKLTPNFFSYTVSKSALWTVTQTLAQGLAPHIRVNAIGPGPTLANPRQSAEGFRKQQQATILQRGPKLAEICAAVRFILDAPSMTGQMIALDGGQHLAWQTPDIYDYDPEQ